MTERIRVPPVDDPDFVAAVRHGTSEPGISELDLVGSADAAAAAPLAQLLETLDGELLERGATQLVLDVRGLDYMSSQCLKQLLLLIGRLTERARDQRYTIKIRSNPTIAWQRHTLPALACFDTSTIIIES